MQLAILLTALSVFAIGTANAAAVGERVPTLGGFATSEQAGCPIGTGPIWVVGFGDGCGECKDFYNSTVVYTTVHSYGFNPYCVLTLFQTKTCSDPGIVSGPGCWEPDGGIAAYKVSCPYWPPNSGGIPYCNH
ncbi:hypothetical protein B0T24DRAFT_642458 [Lasiosphaeria ovina]|uniref:Uncharacterized protein n=1 Tax=Lasiosphaeria ovina TaxID=92902 RepID=A0AAE0MYK1_9PEZI|nr:hypothetical protein B0T24DRAFT_642458 [Lasiosphaeria ovina]